MASDLDPGQKFIGCIVSVRLHPKPSGLVDHITGTVSAIGREEHTITLDNGVLNGLALPDKYRVKADEISTLELITTVADESVTSVEPEFEEAAEPEPEPMTVQTASLNKLSVSETQPKYKNFQEFSSAFQLSSQSIDTSETKPISVGIPTATSTPNKSKANQNGPEIVYTATPFESNYKAKEKSRKSAFNAYATPSNNLNQTPSTQFQAAFTPSQNIIMAKLGLSHPTLSSNSHPPRCAKVEKTPVKQFINKAQNGNHLPGCGPQDRSPRSKSNYLKKDEAFEMTIDEIKAQDYNFEENLAKFDKLPAGNLQKPVAIPKIKTPHFSTSDTTLQANRTIDSVKLKNMKASKVFTTDTGVVIPALEVNIRNRILNMAHDFGLTHNVTLEVFGRAVAQICLPLLGDPYRLSPERVQDRPSVLICTGPHWQGAVAICAARILATQGVDTTLYAPKEEKGVCEKEEALYKYTGNTMSRSLKAIKSKKYDLVIIAMDDQRMDRFSFDPSEFPLQNTEIVLVDPPLLKSYTKALTTTPSRMGAGIGLSKIVIVSPLLPLAYRTNPKIKLFLVNMGIPSDVFNLNGVEYKSPFGDKLIIQFFSHPHEDE